MTLQMTVDGHSSLRRTLFLASLSFSPSSFALTRGLKEEKKRAKSFSYKQTFTGTELGPSPRTKSHIKITSKKTTTKTKKKTPRISLRLDNKSE